MNYYETLEVSPNASQEVIRAAYKSLMQRYHPDKNPRDVEIAEHVILIGRAYDVLSDPIKRAAYDIELNQQPAIDSSIIRNHRQKAQTAPAITKTEIYWVKSAAIVLLSFFAIVAISAALKEEQARTEASNLSYYSRMRAEAERELADEKAAEAAELAKRTIPDFAENLSIPLRDSWLASGNNGHELSIPKLGIRVSKRESEQLVTYIQNNRTRIIQNLMNDLAFANYDELIKIDTQQYVSQLALSSINYSVGTIKKKGDSIPIDSLNDKGVVEILLPESFAVQ